MSVPADCSLAISMVESGYPWTSLPVREHAAWEKMLVAQERRGYGGKAEVKDWLNGAWMDSGDWRV